MESRGTDWLFDFLSDQNRRPAPFSRYTAEELWTDPHVADQMLALHLNPDGDLASRNHAFIQRSVEWLVRTFDLGSGKRVLDLGCGPGLYATRLVELGASVVGVDFSGNSLAHARLVSDMRGLDVVYHQANYLELELEDTFDLVLLIFGDFCPLGPDQRRRLLDNVRGWLAPGGRFVFDVSSRALFESVEESASYDVAPQGGFWSAEPHFQFTHRFKYPTEMAYLDRYVVVEAGRQRELFNWMQCYDPSTLEAELKAAGWEVEETYGDVAGGPWNPNSDFFAVVARPTDLGLPSKP
jgi:SAM-dependent methyltransferase